MPQLDPRIVTIDLEVNGQIKTYKDLAITASGMKYANALQNECQVTITNLDRQTQDYILSETSPFNLNRTPKTITVNAGRQSYGTSKIYVGNIVSSNPTQPPDISVVIKCLTGNFQKGNILARAQPSQVSLYQASLQLAQELRTTLTFQAQDKLLSNFSYSGSVLKQVQHLGFTGGVNVFIDNDVLVVKDSGISRDGSFRMVSAKTGMIGIPELTEQGIKVKFFLDNITKLGGAIQVESDQYPAANGTYVTYKLGFEIANRDTPFYWIAEGARQK